MARALAERLRQQDESRYIVNALNAFLSVMPWIKEGLEGKLGAFGKRMGHLIFKQAVDQDLMANLFASDINVGLDTLQKLRVRCVKNVKETNGEIDFQDAFRFQKRIEE